MAQHVVASRNRVVAGIALAGYGLGCTYASVSLLLSDSPWVGLSTPLFALALSWSGTKVLVRWINPTARPSRIRSAQYRALVSTLAWVASGGAIILVMLSRALGAMAMKGPRQATGTADAVSVTVLCVLSLSASLWASKGVLLAFIADTTLGGQGGTMSRGAG